MKYRVRVLELAGKGKKIHKSQDIIDADALDERNIPELIEKGFIAEVPEKGDKPTQKPPPDPTKPTPYDDITVKELENWLDEKKVTYIPKSKKPILFQLYEDNF